MRSTHSARLERWLGADRVEHLSQAARGWYGPPIPVSGVPGLVYATGDGDFIGPIRGGHYASVADYVHGRLKRIARNVSRRQMSTAHAGFASLQDWLDEATTGGKLERKYLRKDRNTTGIPPYSFWNRTTLPVAGGVGGTSGTGRACTRTTTGALGQANANAGEQLHLGNVQLYGDGSYTLVMYDRLWDMTYNHASATTTAIDASNRPTRYQTSVLAPGNFICSETTTQIAATSHTVTITYVDDAGNAAEAAAPYTQGAITFIDRPWDSTTYGANWFLPLNAGDRGARYLTNIAQSTTTSVTGINNFWVGHVLAFVPYQVANWLMTIDGVISAFNPQRIYDDACIAFFEVGQSVNSVNIAGLFDFIAG